ncbi:MAG TPA: MBG domain-containing protein [Candidatus Didemnitutus sp.]|jgi:hypothetical protein
MIRHILGGASLVVSFIMGAVSVSAADPDTSSAMTSYQYADSPDNLPPTSPIISYQYLEQPGSADLSLPTSSSVSYLYAAAIAATPTTTTSFGSILSGNTRDQTFTLKNPGNTTISGTITVAPPFSVVGGNSYTVAPGQSITVTVRFSPNAPGNYSTYLTFSNGSSWLLTASASADYAATTGAISGRVTSSANGTPLGDVTILAQSPNDDLTAGSPALSGGSGVQAGSYAIAGLVPGSHYHIIATAMGQPYYLKEIDNITIAAGQTTPLDIALDPVPPAKQPPLTTESVPLVLVRGLGANDYPQHDSTWDGFTARMNDAVHHSFTEIWDCDADADIGYLFQNDSSDHTLEPTINGERELAYNAPRLLQYLTARALDYRLRHNGNFPPAINIVTHSMGGLIVRQAIGRSGQVTLRDESGLPFQIKINTVVMLAPPNAGSYLSDALFDPIALQDWASALELEGLIPILDQWLFDNAIPRPSWKSTQNLQTRAIREFSENNPWPDSVNLRLFAATGGSATTGSLRKGNNWILAELQERHLDQSPEAVNDGAVTRPSVDGDFYDSNSLDLLSILSRHSTFETVTGAPVSSSVTDVQVTGHALDHDSLLTDSSTIDAVASVLDGKPWPMATQSLAKTFRDQQGALSAQMQLIESHVAEVLSGSVLQSSMVCDASSKLSFQLLADAPDVAFKLQDPSGNIIEPTAQQTDANFQYSATMGSNTLLADYEISNPASGVWSVVVDATTTNEPQVDFLLTAFVDSNVALIPQTAPQFNQGQDAVVSCTLADLSGDPAVPVTSAAVTAMMQLPDGTTTSLTLADDGLHNDGAPNDGVYAAVLPAVSQAGQYLITYEVTGQDNAGQALQRVGSGTFSVSTENANILGDPVFATIDTDGDGVTDALQATSGVNPMAAGNYILSGQLVDAGATLHIPASAQFYADGTSPLTVSLFFDLALVKAAGVTGDFHIENLQLFEVPSTGAKWVDTYQGTAITQLQAGPQITAQVQDRTIVSGDQVFFGVDAGGGTSINYLWQQSSDGGASWVNLSDDDTYSGATSATLTIGSPTAAMNGYLFRATITNGGLANATSRAATLIVNKADQSAPIVSSVASVAFGAPYTATADSGIGALSWSLGTGSTASGAEIDATTGDLGYTGAGTVVINATFAGDSNHNPATSVDFTIIVNKAPLTVIADSKTRTIGAANPAFTVSYSGFVNSDTAASLAAQPTATTTAILSSPPGIYPIVPSGGASANYAFGYVDGTLTITDGHGAILDINGDGHNDLLWENTAGIDRAIWYMNGTTIVGFDYLAGIPAEWKIVGSGDFDGDGQTDIAWEDTVTGDRTCWFMSGKTIVNFGYFALVDPAWHIAAIGDFDGDGKPDLIWENTVTGDRAVWFLDGQNIKSFGYIAGIDSAWHIIGAADMDGDGQTDLVWENLVTGDRTIWYMNGATLVSFGYIANIPAPWHIAVVADMDGDGHPDLVWENRTTGDRAIWLMNDATLLSAPYLAFVDPIWSIAP